MKITYVTGNWAKIKSARQILEPLGFEIDNIKMDTPEIQDDSIENVAKYSAKWASNELKCDVLKNDSGLCIDALNGFPGPYTHYVDDTLGEDGILKLLAGEENRKAHFVEVLAYCKYGEEPITFTAITPGTISLEKQGTYGWSWDFIFIPDGETKTLGCFEDEIRFKYWSNDAYLKLAEYLKTTTHEMRLHNGPFELIKAKTKTIELRLLDEKRSLIKVNDIIEFTSRTTDEKLKAKVINLHKYNSFEELYKYHDKVSMGYKKDEEANPKDMEQYYPQEEQAKYGVVGIEIEVIDNE